MTVRQSGSQLLKIIFSFYQLSDCTRSLMWTKISNHGSVFFLMCNLAWLVETVSRDTILLCNWPIVSCVTERKRTYDWKLMSKLGGPRPAVVPYYHNWLILMSHFSKPLNYKMFVPCRQCWLNICRMKMIIDFGNPAVRVADTLCVGNPTIRQSCHRPQFDLKTKNEM